MPQPLSLRDIQLELELPPSHFKRLVTRGWEWHRIHKTSLPGGLLYSGLLHVLLFLIVLLPVSYSGVYTGPPELQEVSLEELMAMSGLEELKEGLEEGLPDGGFGLESGDAVYPIEPYLRDRGMRLHVLPKKKRERLERFKQQGERDREEVDIQGNRVRIQTATGVKYIPTEYYFRNSPLEEILARGTDIFFIAGGFPQFPPVGNESSLAEVTDYKMEELASEYTDLQVFLVDEADLPSAKTAEPRYLEKPPLSIYEDSQRVSRLLDGLMGFPEMQQFAFFQRDYLEQFHPDEGDLAHLTRDFIHQNLCNVIVIYNNISSAFGFIEQLYYSKPLDKLYREYWWANPGTRTGAEFLFCQAGHYDFEKRALDYLISAYNEAERVVAEYYTKPDVYQKRAKAYVIVEIHDALMRALKSNGYGSLEEAFDRYVTEQERIYRLIISFHGEEKNSALYALGHLYWDEGDYRHAIATWEEIDNSYAYKTYKAIKKVTDANESLENKIPRIKEILMRENDKSNLNLLDRLVKYHRWEKREKKEALM
jgi:hypothetical protein